MHVLLTGATGFIGRPVARRLRVRGHRITAAVRDAMAPRRLGEAGIEAEAVIAPLEDPAAMADAASRADGVIHLAFDHALQRKAGLSVAEALGAAVDKERRVVAALVGALRGTGKPLVCSTACGILGDTGPTPVSEEHPSPPDFPPALRRIVEHDLLAAVADGVRTAVIRPPLMTHSPDGGGPLPRLLEVVKRTGIAGYVGDGENRLSCVSVEDLAELYVLALERAPPGAIYNGAGGDISGREIAAAMARAAGGDVRIESVSPEGATQMWGPFVATLLAINNRCSNERARTELQWRPYETTSSLTEDLCR